MASITGLVNEHALKALDYMDTSLPMRKRMTSFVLDLQSRIIAALEEIEGPSAKPFKHDRWLRKEGGLGVSATLASGSILEKAGVNISVVHGKLPPPAIKQMRADHTDIPYDPESKKSLPFFAAGVSLVIHPRNPHAPTVHANYRYFEITDDDLIDGILKRDVYPTEEVPEPSGKILAWWFGGGSDLTPTYLVEEDAQTFHGVLKSACDPFGNTIYPAFKDWCDEYFYIPHRCESRGIGGIFFDDLSSGPHKRLHAQFKDDDEVQQRPRSAEEIFAFVRACGDSFIPSYVPILARRHDTPSTDEQRRWQLLRRGRYVEFNLVYDRGTKFGLQTPGARIESILMSLPETARWEYMSDMDSKEGSEEAKMIAVLKAPRNWA